MPPKQSDDGWSTVGGSNRGTRASLGGSGGGRGRGRGPAYGQERSEGQSYGRSQGQGQDPSRRQSQGQSYPQQQQQQSWATSTGPSRGGGTPGYTGRITPIFRNPSGRSTPEPNERARAQEAALVPRRMRTSNVPDVSELSLEDLRPYRPDWGSKGTRTKLWANYFQIDLEKPKLILHRYQVKEITPEAKGRKHSRIIALLLQSPDFQATAGAAVTDFQEIIITLRPLEQRFLNSQVAYHPESQDDSSQPFPLHTVHLEPWSGSDSQDNRLHISELLDFLNSETPNAAYNNRMQVVQAINIILGYHPKIQPSTSLVSKPKSNIHFVLSGPGVAVGDLTGGLEARRGFFTSSKLAASRLLVNLQVKNVAMHKSGPLVNIVTEFLQSIFGAYRNDRLSEHGLMKLASFLNRLRVERVHLARQGSAGSSPRSRPKTICGLASPDDGRSEEHPPRVRCHGALPNEVEFWYGSASQGNTQHIPGLQQNSYVTLADYFQRLYGISTNSGLPVVNVGTPKNPSYLPMEACSVIVGQPALSRLSGSQTSKMIGFAVKRPSENASSISNVGLTRLGLSPASETLKSFGLNVRAPMITVDARVLPAPRLKYSDKKFVPEGGSWSMRGNKVDEPARMPKWAILHVKKRGEPADDPRQTQSWMRKIADGLKSIGMRDVTLQAETQSCTIRHDQDPDGAIREALGKLLRNGVKFVFVLLPSTSEATYSEVKKAADIDIGIPTCCCVLDKFEKTGNHDYLTNVALKVNLKLGGANQAVEPNTLAFIAEGKTMVVGMDVTHPSPGSSSAAPSVSAMVASVNARLAHFPADIRVQTGRTEMIADLADMLKSRLRLWLLRNKEYPRNILVFRDGVSEGQYREVLAVELPKLRDAVRDLYPAGQGAFFTLVVAGKRHHTRFYPTSALPAVTDTKSNNPRNGTVVDRGVTEPRYWDFFLQSHTALKGTARPAHYFVLLDEIFPSYPGIRVNRADVLETLTHGMCYTFGRATKAVSLCPPAYYADLACDRARCYLSHRFTPNRAQAQQPGDLGRDQQDVAVHQNLRNTLFYI